MSGDKSPQYNVVESKKGNASDDEEIDEEERSWRRGYDGE